MSKVEESDSSGVVLGLFGRLTRVRRMKGLRRRIRINNDSGSGGEAGVVVWAVLCTHALR